MHYLYLYINLFSFLPTFIFSFHPKIKFYRHWSVVLPAIVVTALLFILWDMRYTHLGVWGFNPTYLTGVYVGNLPIEEILFFLCIPYACLFTYYCLKRLVQNDYFKKAEQYITLSIVPVLMVAAVYFYPALYTSVTFILLAVVLTLFQFAFRVVWLSRFYFAYLLLLLPFMIVNGLLTGTGIDSAVVWYNPDDMIGLRILTIPIEDVFYGMLMLLCSAAQYEFFLKRKLEKGAVAHSE